MAATAFMLLGSIVVSATFMPACASCHMVGEFEVATASGAHAEVECSGCHGGTTVESRFTFGTAMVTGMVLPIVEVDPSLSDVPSAKCRTCHADVLKGAVQASGLRILHSSCATTRECTECHSPVAHASAVSWPRTATMEMCFDCHGVDAIPSACDVCHSARLPKDRIKTASFAVTHGPKNRVTHGMGNMSTCSQCHGSPRCAKCHGAGLPHSADFVTSHGPVARSSTAKCTGCHVRKFCTDCHGYPMPHSRTFIEQHADTVKKDGELPCRTCHAPQDCTQCHLDHIHPVTADQLRALGVAPVGGGVR